MNKGNKMLQCKTCGKMVRIGSRGKVWVKDRMPPIMQCQECRTDQEVAGGRGTSEEHLYVRADKVVVAKNDTLSIAAAYMEVTIRGLVFITPEMAKRARIGGMYAVELRNIIQIPSHAERQRKDGKQ